MRNKKIEAVDKLGASIYGTKKHQSSAIRSVVGTVEIAESDPDLIKADEYIRAAFFLSLEQSTTQRELKQKTKPTAKKDH